MPQHGFIAFRGVDLSVYRRFKREAAKRGLKLGEAITQAMLAWMQEPREREQVKLLYDRLLRLEAELEALKARVKPAETPTPRPQHTAMEPQAAEPQTVEPPTADVFEDNPWAEVLLSR